MKMKASVDGVSWTPIDGIYMLEGFLEQALRREGAEVRVRKEED